jgi:signal transduction histidine kinase/CheY-like chemotaxis protein
MIEERTQIHVKTAPVANDDQETILVVDDRAINRDFLVSLLGYSGYHTLEADSVAQAIDSIHRDRVDLVITDVQMPEGSGFTLLERLQSENRTAHLPVIVYTAAYRTPDAAAKGKHLGAFAVLHKPTEPQDLLDTVRSALGKPAQEIPLAPVDNKTDNTKPGLGYRAAALVEIMLDLAEEQVPERMLANFRQATQELVGAKFAALHLLPDAYAGAGEGPSSIPANQSSAHQYPALAFPLSDGRPCRRTGVTPAEYGVTVSEEHATDSPVLFLPVRTRFHNYGCLCMAVRLGGGEFSDEDERLGATLATKVALVYENARFHAETQEYAARMAREIEERERSQEELAQIRKEQVRLKDEFLSHVSHELRSPIMAIHQFTEILLDEVAGPLNAQQREYLQIAFRNANQLSTMVSDLLETTRIEAGKLSIEPQAIALAAPIREAVDIAQTTARKKGIEVLQDLSATIPLALADAGRVRQILTNLVDNAIKFTPENGKITLRAELHDDDAFVCVSVADTGCGIPAAETTKIFDRHYQVSVGDWSARKGLGLGLAICKELVERQGGTIWAESEPGAGSRFKFTLPVFSIARLLAPVVMTEALADHVAVITVHAAKENCRDMRPTLERCILPDLDVLLPGTYPVKSGNVFVLVARTDAKGGEVLVRRIEEQLERSHESAGGSVPYQVEMGIVELPRQPSQLGMAEQTANALRIVEEKIRSTIAERS